MAEGDDKVEGPRPPVPQRGVGRVLSPAVAVLAAVYFLIDALFLPPVRLLARWLGGFRLVARIADWIRARGPYQTLALFLVPLIILEPVKPVAAYLAAKGHFARSLTVLVIGEILKITIVERLFHIGRDKLMTIPAFAWAYNYVMRWYAWLEALPAWQAVRRHVRAVKAQARAAWMRMRAWFRRIARSAPPDMTGSAVTARQKTSVILGTATPGGGFPLYGDAVTAVVNDIDPSLAVEPRNTKGSTENIPLLEAGKLDIALVTGEPAYEAFAGIGRPRTDLKILAAMYATPGMFVLRADNPARSIGDLTGKPVAFGARGSGLVILARYVLDGIGLDPDKDFAAVYLDHAGDGPTKVLDGRVAALWGGGSGWPGFAAVANSPGGARFIAPDADEAARIRAKHAFLKPMTVPAGSYAGQAAPIASVGSWSFILARPSLDDDVAYRLARALHRGEESFSKRLAQARETTAHNTAAAAPDLDLIHPGVLRYLREIGVVGS
jgi:TRAP transporter TAXI family solute receptor